MMCFCTAPGDPPAKKGDIWAGRISDYGLNDFVEYQGKKVYFCCKGCETEFNKDPEKYVAKLPQFQQ